MYRSIFVSATNTGVGKTTLAKQMAKLYNEKGIKTLLAKPIESGVQQGDLGDGGLFLEENLHVDENLRMEDISFYRYVLPASPFVAARFEPHLPPIDFKQIEKKLKALQERCDLLIVEGVGGLLVPLDEKVKIIDLALTLRSKILLISPSKLGMINDLLLNQHYLSTHKLDYQITINMPDARSYYQTSKPYIDYLNSTLKDPILIFQEQTSLLLDKLLES
ncbi:dethiobiotin synthase [Helicobacter suis]|uniref:dethiobiotin synthase n=1 Tax=Helicobacter suis TaxID=104628 RepID=UPI0013D727FC|nr:dethiobiotin synthase [Helicobacter suis]